MFGVGQHLWVLTFRSGICCLLGLLDTVNGGVQLHFVLNVERKYRLHLAFHQNRLYIDDPLLRLIITSMPLFARPNNYFPQPPVNWLPPSCWHPDLHKPCSVSSSKRTHDSYKHCGYSASWTCTPKISQHSHTLFMAFPGGSMVVTNLVLGAPGSCRPGPSQSNWFVSHFVCSPIWLSFSISEIFQIKHTAWKWEMH